MEVRVTTAGRLHLGFMDLIGDLGRLYGSIGVALSAPKIEISVSTHNHLCVEDSVGDVKNKIFGFVQAFSDRYQVESNVMIRVHNSIPRHKGLGSGSQLALVLATALAKIYNVKAFAYDLSIIMGRGLRSGIGISCFESGGFIIDSGKKHQEKGAVGLEPPKTVFRYDFPEEWQFVVVIPEKKEGLSGRQEKEAMGFVSPSKQISGEICRLVMMKLLPSLIDRDIETFGSALSDIDRKTGLFFEPVQGGIYCEKQSYVIIDHMLSSGAYGAGQSSWGPTVYGLVRKEDSGSVSNRMSDFLKKNGIEGDVVISSVRNRGADVKVREVKSNEEDFTPTGQ